MCYLTRSPGYGLTLVSESTTGVTHASESSSLSHSRPLPPSPVPVDRVSGEGCAPMLPEDIGQETASQLVQEIVRVSGNPPPDNFSLECASTCNIILIASNTAGSKPFVIIEAILHHLDFTSSPITPPSHLLSCFFSHYPLLCFPLPSFVCVYLSPGWVC